MALHVTALKASSLKRYRDILRLLVRHGGHAIVEGARLTEHVPASDQGDGDPEARAEAEELASDLEAMGPTFVKLGQIMSTRPDLFPPHIIRALPRLQDNVGAFSGRAVEATIFEDLGRPIHEIFATFDARPIASASVAQVHRATLPGGEEVAVKVRRPGLDDLVRFDLSIMRMFATP